MVHICKQLGMLACAALLSVAGAAHASTFAVSYTFTTDGNGIANTITGTVDGTRDGSFIEDLSDIHLSYNGSAFAGSLSAQNWDVASANFDATPARLSTDASQNEFLISDASGSDTFGFINDPAVGGQLVFATDFDVADSAASDLPANGTWAITAVPEPTSLALLLAGLGMIGAARRRRSA